MSMDNNSAMNTSNRQTYQRHGRTTSIDDHSDLQVLRRIKRHLLPKDFTISPTLLAEIVAGYDIGAAADHRVDSGNGAERLYGQRTLEFAFVDADQVVDEAACRDNVATPDDGWFGRRRAGCRGARCCLDFGLRGMQRRTIQRKSRNQRADSHQHEVAKV